MSLPNKGIFQTCDTLTILATYEKRHSGTDAK